MKFIKIGKRHINIEQIASITEDENEYELRMANGDAYWVKDKKEKELVERIINDKEAIGYADVQLPSKRTTERTDRNIQRPAK
jgi:uncharacterized protein YlzI (FlbEa/FlbD family)